MGNILYKGGYLLFKKTIYENTGSRKIIMACFHISRWITISNLKFNNCFEVFEATASVVSRVNHLIFRCMSMTFSEFEVMWMHCVLGFEEKCLLTKHRLASLFIFFSRVKEVEMDWQKYLWIYFWRKLILILCQWNVNKSRKIGRYLFPWKT